LGLALSSLFGMHELAGIEDGYLKVASDSIVFERDEFDGTAEGLRHEESTQCPVIPLVACNFGHVTTRNKNDAGRNSSRVGENSARLVWWGRSSENLSQSVTSNQLWMACAWNLDTKLVTTTYPLHPISMAEHALLFYCRIPTTVF